MIFDLRYALLLDHEHRTISPNRCGRTPSIPAMIVRAGPSGKQRSGRAASIPRLTKAANGVWYVHWSEGPRSKRESTGTRDKATALLALRRWLDQRVGQTEPAPLPGPQPLGKVTCATCWEAYEAEQLVARPESAATARYSWKNLEPHFGGLHPGEVTQDSLERYERQRQAGRIGRPAKPSTVRRELIVLLAAIRFCTRGRLRLVHVDDVPQLVLPLKGAARTTWLTEDELGRLLAAAATERDGARLARIQRFVAVAAATGARQAAVLQLTWDRVDFDARTIDFRDPTVRETRKRRAVVPISDSLLPVLERAYGERTTAFVLDHAGSRSRSKRVAVRAGLEGVGANVLRHTMASHLARGGVPLWIVAKMLGNSMAVVDRVYAKWSADDLRTAANMIKLPADGEP